MKPEPNMALIWAGDYLGGGFKYFLFSSLFWEIIQFGEHIF